MVFFVLAMQHGSEGRLIVFQRNVGDKSEAPLIDADQGVPCRANWRPMLSIVPSPPTTSPRSQCSPNGIGIQRGIPVQSGRHGSTLFHSDLAALALQNRQCLPSIAETLPQPCQKPGTGICLSVQHGESEVSY